MEQCILDDIRGERLEIRIKKNIKYEQQFWQLNIFACMYLQIRNPYTVG